MNWKKEGYKVDQFVFLTIRSMFVNDVRTTEGKVTYVGTKNLTIVTSGGLTIKMKNGENIWHNGIGDYYKVFKSKEEYEKILINQQDMDELREEIIDLLKATNSKKLLKEIVLKLKDNK